MARKQKNKRRRVRGSQIISIISVALVLVILGIVALTAFTARRSTEEIRSNIGFVVKVDDLAPQESAESLRAALEGAPYTASVTARSADEVLEEWKQTLGPDELPDVNPFLPELIVKVKSDWANADSLQAIKARVEQMPAVYEQVEVHSDIASNVNLTIHSIIMALLIVAGTLLVISFVLINNTVRMEIYAQRLIIHTQQYVGAMNSFIRRPYIIRSIIDGIVAALIASIILTGIYLGVKAQYAPAATYIGWSTMAAVAAGLIVIGALVCAIAALLATSKYLRKPYDEIFD